MRTRNLSLCSNVSAFVSKWQKELYPISILIPFSTVSSEAQSSWLALSQSAFVSKCFCHKVLLSQSAFVSKCFCLKMAKTAVNKSGKVAKQLKMAKTAASDFYLNPIFNSQLG